MSDESCLMITDYERLRIWRIIPTNLAYAINKIEKSAPTGAECETLGGNKQLKASRDLVAISDRCALPCNMRF